MRALIDLIKQSFELSVKMRWVKTIDKEANKYKKIADKLFRQQRVVDALVKEYEKIYGENLRGKQE